MYLHVHMNQKVYRDLRFIVKWGVLDITGSDIQYTLTVVLSRKRW